ncbi:MAG: 2OG-Fe(II) oxygenase [Rhizobiaceae bacterium]|nr:2OG-Fe(II) oxygenase [Rhizobiaceae bacterium]
MEELIDLQRYPLDHIGSEEWSDLVHNCQMQLAEHGLFNLPGFLVSGVVQSAADELKTALDENAFIHAREHNIYFKRSLEDLNPDHPALTRFKTVNRTICADQMADTTILKLYEWPEFAAFLAAVMNKNALYTMADPLARVNVMAYREGEALNWHFDRSEFTTTLLLQSPQAGGVFEYAQNLRSDDQPNYEGVAKLLGGHHPTTLMPLQAGTLNVFQGKNTAHRVTPIEGNKDRVIAVFSYFEEPGVVFSDEERIGFYGRAA